MTLRPCLFVGVGGSGGKTLRFLRAQLLRELRARKIDDMPDAWQFLYIDVPTTQEGGGEESQDGLPPSMPSQSYAGLVSDPGLKYPTVDQAVVGRMPVGSLVGWRPSPDAVGGIPIYKGAGQFRTVGRMISVWALERIRDDITRSVNRLNQAAVHQELADVSRAFGFQPAGLTAATDAWVFIVTSLAGGTGSGIFLDVCDVIRSAAQGGTWADNSVGLMYTGEVFGELEPQQRAGVNANSLAALSEVMAGYWSDNASGARRELLMECGLNGFDRSGPRYPFLVGASNAAGVNIGRQVEIYGVVGNALASFLVSPNLQNGLGQYFQGNWVQAGAANFFDSPLLKGAPEQPFSSLGMARLSLGRDRFGDYCTDRLARMSVDHLLNSHLDGVDLEHTTIGEVVDQRASELLVGFLRQGFLNERSQAHNDVIDALRPAGQSDRLAQIRTAVAAGLSSHGSARAPEWGQLIFSGLYDHRGRLLDDRGELGGQEAVELRSQAMAWTLEIQQRLINLVGHFVAQYGFAIVERLLGLVRDELSAVAEELESEAAALNAQYLQVERHIAGALDGVRGNVRSDHDAVANALSIGTDSLRKGAETQVRVAAAHLMRDLSEGFLAPLTTAISSARERLTLQFQNVNPLNGPVVTEWPQGDAVPTRYGARHNEFLLENHEKFPAAFWEQLGRTIGASNHAEIHRKAITGVVTGVEADELDRQRTFEESLEVTLDASISRGFGSGQGLISIDDHWVPTSARFRSDLDSGRSAQLKVSIDVEESLQARAIAFITDLDTAVGRYIDESLDEYLQDSDATPKERADRLARFVDAFRSMITVAAPLTNIDAGARTLAHPNSGAFTGAVRAFSMIPFGDPNSEPYKAVMDEDAALDLDLDPGLFRESRASTISVFSFLGSPLQPHVMKSVVEPIMEDWRKCEARLAAGSDEPLSTFWRLRRSRRLPDFVPLPPASRRAIVRGWFVAKMLGHVTIEDGPKPTVSVWNPKAERWATVNRPMLGGPILNKFDELPRVLETFPVALISQGSAPPGERPIAPFESLAELGWDPNYIHLAGQLEYQTIGPALADWILHGTNGPGTPDEQLAGPAAGSPAERRAACLATIRAAAEAYVDKARSINSVNRQIPTQFFSLSPIAELAEDLERIFDDLTMALASFDVPADANSQGEVNSGI